MTKLFRSIIGSVTIIGLLASPVFAAQTKEELLKMFGESNLVGRVGQPVDLAYPVLYLASDESRFVTGSDFVIDGGEVWKRGGAADAAAKDSAG